MSIQRKIFIDRYTQYFYLLTKREGESICCQARACGHERRSLDVKIENLPTVFRTLLMLLFDSRPGRLDRYRWRAAIDSVRQGLRLHKDVEGFGILKMKAPSSHSFSHVRYVGYGIIPETVQRWVSYDRGDVISEECVKMCRVWEVLLRPHLVQLLLDVIEK